MTTSKNLIRTNTKVYRNRIYKYLLENINFENNEGEELELSDKQKIEYFFNEFESIASHPYNLKRFPNTQDRLADYLQGLPSGINIPYMNYDILELAKTLHGTKVLTEKEENSILKYYWPHMAFMLISLKESLKK